MVTPTAPGRFLLALETVSQCSGHHLPRKPSLGGHSWACHTCPALHTGPLLALCLQLAPHGEGASLDENFGRLHLRGIIYYL